MSQSHTLIDLPGRQGAVADAYTHRAVDLGTRAITALAASAVARIVNGGPPVLVTTWRLFSNEELRRLIEVFAATLGTADLLARSNVRQQWAMVLAAHDELPVVNEAAANRLNRYFRFWVGDRLREAGADDPSRDVPTPMPPDRAIEFFRSLTPALGVDPQRWGDDLRRRVFTLAVATDQSILRSVQKAIGDRLQSGEAASGPQAIREILDAAGVSPRNPQYAEAVWRTNVNDALNQAADEERRDPEVIEAFPVWRYANPDDSRSRPEHAARDGNYYPAEVPFTSVRGTSAGDSINCRCVLPGAFVQGVALAASKSWYSGQACELRTRSGNRISVTPNHPVLSKNGFVSAGKIENGDYLVSYRGKDPASAAGYDVENKPATIEQVFGAIQKIGVVCRIGCERRSTLDFHGDAAAVYGDVDVVSVNGELGRHFDSASANRCSETQFDWPGKDVELLSRCGTLEWGNNIAWPTKVGQSIRFAHLGPSELCRFRKAASGNARFDQPVLNSSFVHSGGGGELTDRFSGKVSSCQFFHRNESAQSRFSSAANTDSTLKKTFAQCRSQRALLSGQIAHSFAGEVTLDESVDSIEPLRRTDGLSFGTAAELDAILAEPAGESVSSDADLLRQLFAMFPGEISLDEVVEVRRFHYSGPVYDMQTDTGYYIATRNVDNIFAGCLVGNCTFIAVSKWKWAKLKAAGARIADGYADVPSIDEMAAVMQGRGQRAPRRIAATSPGGPAVPVRPSPVTPAARTRPDARPEPMPSIAQTSREPITPPTDTDLVTAAATALRNVGNSVAQFTYDELDSLARTTLGQLTAPQAVAVASELGYSVRSKREAIERLAQGLQNRKESWDRIAGIGAIRAPTPTPTPTPASTSATSTSTSTPTLSPSPAPAPTESLERVILDRQRDGSIRVQFMGSGPPVVVRPGGEVAGFGWTYAELVAELVAAGDGPKYLRRKA